MQTIFKKRNLFSIFTISFFCLFFMASFTSQKSYAEYGEGVSCRTSEGYSGTCWDRASHSCSTYYDSGYYCPGDNSVQCCVTSQRACNPPGGSGYCHNRYADGYGNAYNCSGGSWNSGNYCPGPYDVQCCVRPPTPTPTRTPTPTSTPTPTPSLQQKTSTPGIIFTGRGSANFGQGQASVKNWVVGGLTYPEVYPTAANPSTTSYQYLLDKTNSAKIPITNLTSLSTCTSLTNCTLPANLLNGVYRATGNTTLNAYTFPANRNYVFLINGDLRINGNLVVPNGSTALFSTSRDIIVSNTVGATTNTFPLPAGQIQGLLSANRNFTIQGINDCITGPDRMLNIEGAIVVNAGGTGGVFTNQRDLCGFNLTIPSLTVRSRLDFLLNMPEFLMKRTTIFREEAP